ncbi:hypothetical protein [Butyrivibrio sp. XPD2006]|uniref:hypothetical protein n=1 Tax=Butyrivibrio sp. XPD2006 TaxID=1280668 RepID=UPI0003B2FB92|nr:hypothetical protein [Butyrivibrio sp. XPD2006]
MRKASEKDYDRVIKYLSSAISECLYLYIDIKQYRFENSNIGVWIEEKNGKIEFVSMKYYDSFQLYCKGLPDQHIIDDVANLISLNPVSMIEGRKDIIEFLCKIVPGYETSYGVIYQIDDEGYYENNSEDVTVASEDDAYDIANLICSNKDIGGYYSVDGLAKQLADRIRSGVGRSIIIKRDGKVCAHIATYAEADDVAVISGLIVHSKGGKSDDYLKIRSYLVKLLREENKKAYGYVNADRLIKFHDKIHKRCCEYGKMVISKS